MKSPFAKANSICRSCGGDYIRVCTSPPRDITGSRDLETEKPTRKRDCTAVANFSGWCWLLFHFTSRVYYASGKVYKYTSFLEWCVLRIHRAFQFRCKNNIQNMYPVLKWRVLVLIANVIWRFRQSIQARLHVCQGITFYWFFTSHIYVSY